MFPAQPVLCQAREGRVPSSSVGSRCPWKGWGMDHGGSIPYSVWLAYSTAVGVGERDKELRLTPPIR